MNIDLDQNTILTIIIVLVVLYWVYTQKCQQEKWTMLAGAPQQWGPQDWPSEKRRCDADYNDDECKFSSVNCVNNPNSYFYQN